MSESELKATSATQLVQKTMDSVMQQKTEQTRVCIEARQEFSESYSSSYEEEFEEEIHIDSSGNTKTIRNESSSSSEESNKSAKVQVKASGLNQEQMQALTQASNELGEVLALQDKSN